MDGLARRLRPAREARGLSQQDLAEALDTTVMTVWRYESGRSYPHLYTLDALSRVLMVPQGWLLGEGPDDVPPAESAAQAPEPGDAA